MNLTSGNQTRVTDAENIRLIIRNEDFFVFNRCFMSQSQLEKKTRYCYTSGSLNGIHYMQVLVFLQFYFGKNCVYLSTQEPFSKASYLSNFYFHI